MPDYCLRGCILLASILCFTIFHGENNAVSQRAQLEDWALGSDFQRIEQMLESSIGPGDLGRLSAFARTVRYLKHGGKSEEPAIARTEGAVEQLEAHVRSELRHPGPRASAEDAYRYHFKRASLEQLMDNRMAALEHFLEARRYIENPALNAKIVQLRNELKGELEELEAKAGGKNHE